MTKIDWEDFKQADAASYDAVATSFDRLSDRFAAPVADELVAQAAPQDGQRVLDIATGTGIVTRAVRQRAPGAQVVGIETETSLEVVRLVEQAGFTLIRTQWKGSESIVETPELFWELQAVFSSRVRKRLEVASTRAIEGPRADFDQRCDRVRARGGALVYPHAALTIIAQRPSR